MLLDLPIIYKDSVVEFDPNQGKEETYPVRLLILAEHPEREEWRRYFVRLEVTSPKGFSYVPYLWKEEQNVEGGLLYPLRLQDVDPATFIHDFSMGEGVKVCLIGTGQEHTQPIAVWTLGNRTFFRSDRNESEARHDHD